MINSAESRLHRFTVCVLFLAGIAAGCKEDIKPTSVPSVITGEITGITSEGATANGQVVTDGNLTVMERGIVLGEFSDPTISDEKVVSGSGIGTFIASLSGLVPGTTYHVRAYAINTKGISYGLDRTFSSAATVPSVTTAEVTSIGLTTAVSGGTITSDGGSSIIARGVVYSTTPSPTIAENKTTDGSGDGSFVSSLTGLPAGTKIYIRAYATNTAGTAYGEQLSFITVAGLTDVDGNFYNTVTIGNQVWMKENLRVTRYRNGDPIPYYLDNATWASLTTGSYAYYNHDLALEKIYGKLYNWFAAVDSRGLCPIGWHVPSDADWTTLVAALGGEAVAGGKMKSTGTDLWRSPNTGATNESGFSGLPSAFRHYSGYFANLGDVADWWSSTERDAGIAREQNLGYIYSSANTYFAEKQDGFAIRCLKD